MDCGIVVVESHARLVRLVEGPPVAGGEGAQNMGVWHEDQETRPFDLVAFPHGELLGRLGEGVPVPVLLDFLEIGGQSSLFEHVDIKEDGHVVRSLAGNTVLHGALAGLEESAGEEVLPPRIVGLLHVGHQVQQSALVIEVTAPVHRGVHGVGHVPSGMGGHELAEVLAKGDILQVELNVGLHLSEPLGQILKHSSARPCGHAPPIPIGDGHLLRDRDFLLLSGLGFDLLFYGRRRFSRLTGAHEYGARPGQRRPGSHSQHIATTYLALQSIHFLLLTLELSFPPNRVVGSVQDTEQPDFDVRGAEEQCPSPRPGFIGFLLSELLAIRPMRLRARGLAAKCATS